MTKRRLSILFHLLAALVIVGPTIMGAAFAIAGDVVNNTPVESKPTIVNLTKSPQTCLAAVPSNLGQIRHGWTIMAAGTNGADTTTILFTVSTKGGVTQTGAASNSRPLPGGMAWTEDGSGGVVYNGIVTAFAQSTTSSPVATCWSW